MDIFWLSFSLFLVMDSVGCIPLYIAILKGLPEHRQYLIILREMFVALIIMILFNFAGEALLDALNISHESISVAGGMILFILGLKMVFPSSKRDDEILKIKEPFIVPLAVPLIAGPAVLATVMLYAHQEASELKMLGAIFFAWLASLIVLLPSPYLAKKLGEKGILAIQRLMGLILILLAVQMFLNGIHDFVVTTFK